MIDHRTKFPIGSRWRYELETERMRRFERGPAIYVVRALTITTRIDESGESTIGVVFLVAEGAHGGEYAELATNIGDPDWTRLS